MVGVGAAIVKRCQRRRRWRVGRGGTRKYDVVRARRCRVVDGGAVIDERSRRYCQWKVKSGGGRPCSADGADYLADLYS